jgi:glycosyltransferase involved in cell wall biosynthesis
MTAPLSLLHVHSGNLYGGIERVLVTLRRFEEGSALRHHYALAFDGRLRNELGERVAAVGRVHRRYPWSVRAGQRRLREIVARTRPHVVMVHGGWAQALLGPAVTDAGLPLVRWFHGAPEPDDPWERRATECPPVLAVCNSRFTASAAAPFTVGVPLEVLHPPVPAPPAAPEPARTRLRAHAAAAGQTAVLLHVARMEAGKGHGVLLEALARMPATLDWQAWFVGGAQRPAESRYLRGLERRVARSDGRARVRFLGERHDTSALYAAADLYCQPNTAPDAFGLTFVEALYAGLPVVTSALGGAREIVTDGCGVLVPPGDATALAAALLPLLADPDRRAALGIRGPARATALCQPERQIGRLAQLLSAISRETGKGKRETI